MANCTSLDAGTGKEGYIRPIPPASPSSPIEPSRDPLVLDGRINTQPASREALNEGFRLVRDVDPFISFSLYLKQLRQKQQHSRHRGPSSTALSPPDHSPPSSSSSSSSPASCTPTGLVPQLVLPVGKKEDNWPVEETTERTAFRAQRTDEGREIYNNVSALGLEGSACLESSEIPATSGTLGEHEKSGKSGPLSPLSPHLSPPSSDSPHTSTSCSPSSSSPTYFAFSINSTSVTRGSIPRPRNSRFAPSPSSNHSPLKAGSPNGSVAFYSKPGALDLKSIYSNPKIDNKSPHSHRMTSPSLSPSYSKRVPLKSTSLPSPNTKSPAFSHSFSSNTYRHLFAVHSKERASCLTHGTPDPPSFGGFRNLMILMLIVSNLRLMIENFRKYGVLICIQCHDYRKQDVIYGLVLYLSVPCHLLIAYLIELFAARQATRARNRILEAIALGKKFDDSDEATRQKRLQDLNWQRNFKYTWYLVAWVHTINATLNLIIASSVVYHHIFHPLIGTLCEMHAIIVWLKTCSFAFTNRDLRHVYLAEAVESAENEGTDRGGGMQHKIMAKDAVPGLYRSCPYPENISMGNLVYFWWAPTLVYQPVYPRTDRIRWVFVAKRTGEMVGLGIVVWIATAQYAAPLLRNSLATMETLDIVSICERVLKLSTISLFCWLAGFFAFFQSFLNVLAELVRFGDRDFYADWWNAPTIRIYWTSWNRPVSRFMRRHIYTPLVARGVKPMVAQISVFLLSGLLHELLVGMPTHNLIGVAFMGMVLQIPLIIATDLLYQPTKGPRMPCLGEGATGASPSSVARPSLSISQREHRRERQPVGDETIGGGANGSAEDGASSPGGSYPFTRSPRRSSSINSHSVAATLTPATMRSSKPEDQQFVSQPRSRTAAMVGNMVFWISFCLVGQPLAAMLYFFAWEAKYGSASKTQMR